MQKAKLLGIIGSGILCFGYLPTFTIYISIIGFILIGVSLKILSKEKDKFFDYFLIGSVLSVIATFLFYFKIFAIITSFVIALMSNNPVIPLTFSVMLYFIIYYVLVIVSSYFFYKSFYEIYLSFNNQFFRYAGLLMVLGAVLMIFGVGFVFQVIGWFLALLGFFSLNDEIIVEVEVEKIEKKN